MLRPFILLISLLVVSACWAQKKPLTIEDFKSWKAIDATHISASGKWVSYHLKPQKGNTRLVLHNIDRLASDTIENVSKSAFAFFTPYLITTVVPDYQLIRSLKLKKEKKETFPKDSLFVRDLRSGKSVFLDRVKSWKLPETNGHWLAYLKYSDEVAQDPTVADSADTNVTELPQKKKAKDQSDLVLYELTTGKKWTYPNVEEYVLSRNGRICIFNSQDTTTGKGIHAFHTENAMVTHLQVEAETYTGLCVDTMGLQAAFVHTSSRVKDEVDDFTLSIFNIAKNIVVASIDSHQLQLLERISKHRKPEFSENGRRIKFGIKNASREFPKDTTILDEEKPQVDIWSHHDDRLQPEQLKSLKKDQERSRIGLYDIKKKKHLILTDQLFSRTVISEKDQGNFALSYDSGPYNRQKSWESPWAKDVYLHNLRNGNTQLFQKAFIGTISFSPAGKYLYWFDQETSDWWIMSLKTKRKFSPSQELGKIFHRSDDDHPAKPSSYRIGGWLEGDERIFINDKYGFWSIDPAHEAQPMRLGGSEENHQVWRIEWTDRTVRYLAKNEPIRIRVFNKKTKESHIKSWTNLNSAEDLETVSQKGSYYQFYLQSKNKKVRLFKIHQSGIFPDIYLKKHDFVRLSNTNPQQKRFKWYQTEIINYTSADGEALQGILYKPESYNESKKYPVIVYFYEQLSDYVHSYQIPAPSRSTISRSFYCSNDYFVFVPDITYKVGHPGKSAFNCIVPGVMQLIKERPYLDKTKLALQGQSWGGYQTAYLITQTDLFACAMAGAPVSNMTSAYGGIRWGSGLNPRLSVRTWPK